MTTSTAAFTIQPATPTEVPTLVEIFDAAFRSEASERLFPRKPDVKEFWEATFTGFLNPKPDTPQSRIFTAKDEAGNLVGMVLWWIVLPGGINPWLDRVTELPPSVTREMIVEWAEPQVQNNHKYMGEIAHIFLDTLAVRDTCRGKGLGEKLVRAVTKEADELGYPTYLDATVKAISLYERCGFIGQPKGESRSVPMVRPSKTESAQ
ncbi:hypothetical protein MCOR25_001503 [Pyricularia grisea]|nr:hypothetical protein MCOR25_001503 [Pyricularia grisea]